MMKVNEVSKLTGVSIRTLQYYDSIGLLKPSGHTEAGYRLYDDTALERLQQILLFRELEFSLKEIREIIDRSGFDRNQALEQQIELLTLKKEHLENLDLTVFDTKKIDEYTKRAKAQWGETPEFREYEKKAESMTDVQQKDYANGLMMIFAEFGEMKEQDAAGDKAQQQVAKLQDYISEHYYSCSKEVLAGLGKMYNAGGEFTENIDSCGGKGTADFASRAIEIYCAS